MMKAKAKAKAAKRKKYVVVRTCSAGVFAGVLQSKNGDEVVLSDAIRLWYWSGAASLSQLAMEGVKNPTACKFAVPVTRITLVGVIEIIDTTSDAERCIKAVKPWKQ